MRKSLFLILTFLPLTWLFAQVGIGTTDPNPDALLDIDATDTKGGLLMPRVELVSTTNASPLINHVPGMTLYNTATTSGADGVSPGYYYNNGSQWMRLATEDNSSNSWQTSGNEGTDPTSNFIGTTDDKVLRIRTNNVNRFTINRVGSILSASNGTAAEPSYSWDIRGGFDRTGIFMPALGNIGFSSNGDEIFRITNRQVVSILDGREEIPAYSWENSRNTGIYQYRNTIGFSTDGVGRFTVGDGYQVWAMGAGTAALPFYSWSSHPGTGIYKPGTHNLGFSTNGVERMRVNSNGNVGVGTNDPSQRLHVNGNFSLQGAFMPNNNAGSSDEILLSGGANTTPRWGYKISRFISDGYDMEPGSRLMLTFDYPGINRNATVIANIRSGYSVPPNLSIDNIEVMDNSIRISARNLTGTNLDVRLNIMVIEWN